MFITLSLQSADVFNRGTAQPADSQTEDAGSWDRHTVRAAPRVAAIGACPLTPGNNLPSSLCNKQPESQKLNQAGRGGQEERAQENRDSRFNQYCNPAVSHCLYEPAVGSGGGGGYLFIWHVGFSSCNMEMRHTAGEVCLFVIRAENIPPTTCQSINLEAVLYFCTAEDPPIPHTNTRHWSSCNLLTFSKVTFT